MIGEFVEAKTGNGTFRRCRTYSPVHNALLSPCAAFYRRGLPRIG